MNNISIPKKFMLQGKGKFGFTLAELLVVLAVIGLLLASVMAIFSNSRARARDSRRVADMDTLQKALALYLSITDQYPQAAGPPGEVINGADTLSTALKNRNILIGTVMDPRSGQSAGGGNVYEYRYWSTSNNTYSVTYCMETSAIKPTGCGNTVSP